MASTGNQAVVAIAQNKYTPIIIGVLVAGGLLGAYFLVAKPILEGTGIKRTKYDKRLPKLKGLDPNYYKDNISKVTISTQQASKIADDVFRSYGFSYSKAASTSANPIVGILGTYMDLASGFGNDNEELLHGAISSAGSEYNLSKVSDVFQKRYKENMASYIINFADNTDTEAMYNIIKSW